MSRLMILATVFVAVAVIFVGCQNGSNPFESEGSNPNRTMIGGQELASIGDYVWYDENMDGLQDIDETGIPGITVNLYDGMDSLVATDTTDEDGLYLFTDLEAGDYFMEFIAPESLVFTLQDQGGNDSLDSDADPTTGRTVPTTLDSGETDLCWDAGLHEFPEENCTRSKGYWKNHAGLGPQPDMVTRLLPIWLGTEDSLKSIEVIDAETAVDILCMRTYGRPSNGITKLYAQLLAAKLNIENGADDEDVADTIEDADSFLADYDWEDWNDLSHDDRAMVLGWKDTLDDYNNGRIGPGPCDEWVSYQE